MFYSVLITTNGEFDRYINMRNMCINNTLSELKVDNL